MDDKQNGLYQEETHESALNRVKSAGLLTISPELFEKLYLQPQTSVKGDLRRVLGNPTPLYVGPHTYCQRPSSKCFSRGLVGFVVGLTPFACNLMGWRGSNVGPNTGAANM